MSATVADLNPKTIESAKRQFVELYGSALVMNTYLKIALAAGLAAWPLGLLALNFRTQAKLRECEAPGDPDRRGRTGRGRRLRRGRLPAAGAGASVLPDPVRGDPFQPPPGTVQRDYPDSLFFLEPALADATIAQNDQNRTIEGFLTNPSATRSTSRSRTSRFAS